MGDKCIKQKKATQMSGFTISKRRGVMKTN